MQEKCISSILYKTSYWFFKTVLLLFYKKKTLDFWFWDIMYNYIVLTQCAFFRKVKDILYIFSYENHFKKTWKEKNILNNICRNWRKRLNDIGWLTYFSVAPLKLDLVELGVCFNHRYNSSRWQLLQTTSSSTLCEDDSHAKWPC